MGAIESTPTKYLNVSMGKLRQRVTESHPKAVTRYTKDGNQIHEIIYLGWKGVLIGMESRAGKFGPEVKVVMDDDTTPGGVVKIGMPFISDSFIDFAKRLLNFTAEEIATKEIELSPFQMTNDNGYKSDFVGLRVAGEQDIRKVKFNKQNPGDMPEWEELPDPKTGKMTWSKVKQCKWLAAEVAKLLNEANSISIPEEVPQPSGVDSDYDESDFPDGVDSSDDVDDLPF